MRPSSEQIAGLNIAINEATLFGVDLALDRSAMVVELGIVGLPEQGAATHQRIRISLFPLHRLAIEYAASDGEARTIRIEEVSELVKAFGGLPIYGWEFFDGPSSGLAGSSHPLSLDYRRDQEAQGHSLHLFQENAQEAIDIYAWFDEIAISRPDQQEVELDVLIAGGKRLWDGIASGDPRTKDTGIERLE